MNVKQLIKRLEEGNENAIVYIRTIDDNGNIIISDSVGISFDDKGGVELYEAV